MGTHNGSEDGRGAWVAFRAHRIHTDTVTCHTGRHYIIVLKSNVRQA
jgi:hypothetical protein